MDMSKLMEIIMDVCKDIMSENKKLKKQIEKLKQNNNYHEWHKIDNGYCYDTPVKYSMIVVKDCKGMYSVGTYCRDGWVLYDDLHNYSMLKCQDNIAWKYLEEYNDEN